jgi:hypothetical protein
MKIATLISPLVFVGALMLTHPATAKQISIQGFDSGAVKKACGGGDQVYFPPTKNGVYGCVNGDGSGIVCGGVGKDPKTGASFSKTCDTFRKVPPHLPTRDEIIKAGEGNPTQ